MGIDWRASAVRLALLVAGLLAANAVFAMLFTANGRALGPALAGGAGIVGLAMAVVGLVLLAIVRTGSKRITYATAFGALVLSLPFFAAALVI